YTYDVVQKELPTATNIKGKLTRVDYPGGRYLFSYNKMGGTLLERKVVMGVALDFAFEYSYDNVPVREIFPDGRSIAFQRDGAARPTAIPGYVEAISYHSDGMLKSWTAGNGIRTEYAYDVRQRHTKIDVGAGKVMTLNLELDTAGNVNRLRQQHGDLRFDNTYNYDALYRLTQADLSSNQERLSFQQNKLHNLTTKTSSLEAKSPAHVGEYNFYKDKIHAVSKAGSIALRYDDAGQMTQRGALSMQWDYLGRCVDAKRDGQTVARYWYGVSRKMEIREELGKHVFYINKNFEIRDGRGVIYLLLNQDRVAALHSSKIVARFFDDVAPLVDGKPKPDNV
ncbi:MAG: hypothetical protein AAGJ35_16135, partial [Myxococcota bacterium]